MRRGLRIEGAYKLCQTFFVQFNLAELVDESKELEKTFRPSQWLAGKGTHALVNIKHHW